MAWVHWSLVAKAQFMICAKGMRRKIRAECKMRCVEMRVRKITLYIEEGSTWHACNVCTSLALLLVGWGGPAVESTRTQILPVAKDETYQRKIDLGHFGYTKLWVPGPFPLLSSKNACFLLAISMPVTTCCTTGLDTFSGVVGRWGCSRPSTLQRR